MKFGFLFFALLISLTGCNSVQRSTGIRPEDENSPESIAKAIIRSSPRNPTDNYRYHGSIYARLIDNNLIKHFSKDLRRSLMIIDGETLRMQKLAAEAELIGEREAFDTLVHYGQTPLDYLMDSYEGTELKLDSTRISRNEASVKVGARYESDGKVDSPYTGINTIQLRKESNSWVIYEIEFIKNYEFGSPKFYKSNLSQRISKFTEQILSVNKRWARKLSFEEL